MIRCYRHRRSFASLALAAFALLIGACGGDGGRQRASISDGTIEIPQSAIEELTNYTFTTHLDISSAEGALTVRFDGGFQAPDRIEGTLTTTGDLLERSAWEQPGRPAETEMIVIGEQLWWRETGEEWQFVPPPYDSVHPFVLFSQYATPWFYLEALRFDSLALSVSGSLETLNGVRAYPVRLDTQAVIDVIRQGTAIKRYPDEEDEHGPVYPGIVENAQQVLPQDFLVEVWFAEDGTYPVRIVFDYSIDEGESCALCWAFRRPLTLRLQMDITDPDADVEIEPPATADE